MNKPIREPIPNPIHLCHINLGKGFRGGERQTFLPVKALAPYLSQTAVVRKCSGLSKALKDLSDIGTIDINHTKDRYLEIYRVAAK